MEEQNHAHGRPDPSESDFPAVLRLTSMPAEEFRKQSIARAGRVEAGEEVPHTRNFENPSDLRALLTDRRLELLNHVMAEPPASIRALADELNRDVRQVHDDLQLFSEHGIVFFKEGHGNAKQPYIPYDRVDVEMTILADDTAGGRSHAQAD